ncbi:unnamed protein product [Paramecium pentaurelia]|uniref:Uncharacterized protein n=1 Tax=Paramecium pentaurelia TaxID=43138 RepID=A0A8S1TME7_9CILI|nr:unnamed protein product [Paramecium pentaurelia]
MKPWNKNRANSLLLKDSVGAAKQSIYTIPNDIYFGKAIVHDTEGAQQVTSTWYYHNHSELNPPDRDFTKLNKMCISNKLHDQKQFYLFRKSNDARVFRKRGCSQIEMNLPDENFRYGKPYLPQSPMKNVLSGSYMNEAEQLMDKKYDAISKHKLKQSKRPSTATKHTKASKLAYQSLIKSLNQTQQHQFKLKEFDKVQPKTKTRF